MSHTYKYMFANQMLTFFSYVCTIVLLIDFLLFYASKVQSRNPFNAFATCKYLDEKIV